MCTALSGLLFALQEGETGLKFQGGDPEWESWAEQLYTQTKGWA